MFAKSFKLLPFHNLKAFSLKAEKFIRASRQRRLFNRGPTPGYTRFHFQHFTYVGSQQIPDSPARTSTGRSHWHIFLY